MCMYDGSRHLPFGAQLLEWARGVFTCAEKESLQSGPMALSICMYGEGSRSLLYLFKDPGVFYIII